MVGIGESGTVPYGRRKSKVSALGWKDAAHGLLKIGQLAELAGVTAKAVRAYESAGVLPLRSADQRLSSRNCVEHCARSWPRGSEHQSRSRLTGSFPEEGIDAWNDRMAGLPDFRRRRPLRTSWWDRRRSRWPPQISGLLTSSNDSAVPRRTWRHLRAGADPHSEGMKTVLRLATPSILGAKRDRPDIRGDCLGNALRVRNP